MKFPYLVLGMVVSLAASADEGVRAHVSGNTYLGLAGNSAEISLDSVRCVLESEGQPEQGEFRLVFTCGNRNQVLWDMHAPVPGDFAFDEPRFSLLWAGDRDGDGRIDLVMEMSPKYSCSREVTYLSSLAQTKELLGVAGSPETVCGA